MSWLRISFNSRPGTDTIFTYFSMFPWLNEIMNVTHCENVLILFSAVILISSSVCAQTEPSQGWDNGIGHKNWVLALNPEDNKKLRELWNEIGEDIKTEDSDSAGTYVKSGYSSGYFLRWSRKKGYIFIPYFDQNLIPEFSYGGVSLSKRNEVVFSPVQDLKSDYGTFKKMPTRWIHIWEYFLPVSEIQEFGKYHAGLGKYNEFNDTYCCEWRPRFLATRNLNNVEVEAFPVPEQYKKYIIRPIKGKIIFVGKKIIVGEQTSSRKLKNLVLISGVLTPVRINIGKNDRVKLGMLFRIMSEPNLFQNLRVTKVNLKTSDGYVIRDLHDGKEQYQDIGTEIYKAYPPIKIGNRITSSPERN